MTSNQRRECRHETLRFGSGDYYIFCANSECGARWVCCGTGSDLPDAHLSNQGIGGQLSGQERIAVETAAPRATLEGQDEPFVPQGNEIGNFLRRLNASEQREARASYNGFPPSNAEKASELLPLCAHGNVAETCPYPHTDVK